MLTGTLTVIIHPIETLTGIGIEKEIANTGREVVKTGKIHENIFKIHEKFLRGSLCGFEFSILVEGKVYCLTVL